MEPALGSFIEIKSRTWSRKDAENKSELAIKLLKHLGIAEIEPISADYIEVLKTLEY